MYEINAFYYIQFMWPKDLHYNFLKPHPQYKCHDFPNQFSPPFYKLKIFQPQRLLLPNILKFKSLELKTLKITKIFQ